MSQTLKDFLIILIAIILFFITQRFVELLDSKIYSFMESTFYSNSSSKNHSSNVVIVNVDEKSMEEIKHWPWSRIIYAQLIHTIDEMNPSTIGFNMHFLNQDKSSPKVMKQFYKRFFNINKALDNIPKELEDNDKLLAKNLANTNSVLSIQMDNQNKKSSSFAETISYNIINMDSIKGVEEVSHISCNTKELHLNNPHFGFSTIDISNDGIIETVPLLKKYKEHVIPSFGLAVLLSLNIHQYQENEHRLTFLNNTLYLDKYNRILLNFNTPKPRVFSAIDVLTKNVPPEAFHGKIVIIGSDMDGFDLKYMTYNNETLSSSMIHATLIESLLNGTYFMEYRPSEGMVIILPILLFVLLYLLLIKEKFYTVVISILLLLMFSIILLIYSFFIKEYIHIGYIWSMIFYLTMASLIIYNTKKNNRLEKDLSKSYVTTATSMTLVANTHDLETGEHLIRTKKYVQLLAQKLYKKKFYTEKLNPHYIELIYEAAPLHDIGKVGIPDSILKKPGKFTKEEFNIMKQHSRMGANIIKESLKHYEHNPLLEVGYNIALYHHEKWDGTGYPEQLKGDEIPLEAQLMSVADVYDALITKRRYKEPFTYEKAESIIISERGKHFNPLLVDIFIEEKENFKAISLEWHEEEKASNT